MDETKTSIENSTANDPISEQETPEKRKRAVKQETKTPSSSKGKAGAGPLIWLITLVNFIALVGIGAVVYWLWPQYQAQHNQEIAQITRLEGQSAQLVKQTQQQMNQFQEQLIETQKVISEQVTMMEQADAQLTDFRRSLVGLSDRRPQDWLIAEAEYLVRVAARKLYLEQDVKTAIQLLQDADAQLASLQDTRLLGLRELLAADIQTLKSVPLRSTTEIALKLRGLLAQSSQLAFIQPNLTTVATTESANTLPSTQMSQWRENLKASWRGIKAQFAIRVFDGEVIAQMDDQQKWWLLQRYQLVLTQAQGAALQRNDDLFHGYVAQAEEILLTYFANHDQSVQGALDTLAELKSLATEQATPRELDALAPIQSFLQGNVVQRNSSENSEDAQ